MPADKQKEVEIFKIVSRWIVIIDVAKKQKDRWRIGSL